MTSQLILLDIDLTATESTLLIMLLAALFGGLIYFIKKYLDKIDSNKETTVLFGKIDKILEQIGLMKEHAAELTVTVDNTNKLVHEMRSEYLDVIRRLYEVEKDCSVKHAISKKGGRDESI